MHAYDVFRHVLRMSREEPAQLAIGIGIVLTNISHPLMLLAGEGVHEQHSPLPLTNISRKSASVFETSKI